MKQGNVHLCPPGSVWQLCNLQLPLSLRSLYLCLSHLGRGQCRDGVVVTPPSDGIVEVYVWFSIFLFTFHYVLMSYAYRYLKIMNMFSSLDWNLTSRLFRLFSKDLFPLRICFIGVDNKVKIFKVKKVNIFKVVCGAILIPPSATWSNFRAQGREMRPGHKFSKAVLLI